MSFERREMSQDDQHQPKSIAGLTFLSHFPFECASALRMFLGRCLAKDSFCILARLSVENSILAWFWLSAKGSEHDELVLGCSLRNLDFRIICDNWSKTRFSGEKFSFRNNFVGFEVFARFCWMTRWVHIIARQAALSFTHFRASCHCTLCPQHCCQVDTQFWHMNVLKDATLWSMSCAFTVCRSLLAQAFSGQWVLGLVITDNSLVSDDWLETTQVCRLNWNVGVVTFFGADVVKLAGLQQAKPLLQWLWVV